MNSLIRKAIVRHAVEHSTSTNLANALQSLVELSPLLEQERYASSLALPRIGLAKGPGRIRTFDQGYNP